MKKLLLLILCFMLILPSLGCYRDEPIPATGSPTTSESASPTSSPSETAPAETPDTFLTALNKLSGISADSFILVNIDLNYEETSTSGMPELLLFSGDEVEVFTYQGGQLVSLGGTDTPGTKCVRVSDYHVAIKTRGGHLSLYIQDGDLYFYPFYDTFSLSLASRFAIEEEYFGLMGGETWDLLKFSGMESVKEAYLNDYLKKDAIPAFDGLLIDLDGDGDKEEVSLISPTDHLRLSVDGKLYPGEYSRVLVGDLNKEDGLRELMPVTLMDNDLTDLKVARFQNGNFVNATLPETGIDYAGVGEDGLLGFKRSDFLGTNFFVVGYDISNDFTFTEVVPDYYSLDLYVTLKVDVTAVMESGEELEIASGTKLEIVATDLKTSVLFRLHSEYGYATYGELPASYKTVYVKDEDGKIVNWYDTYTVCSLPQDDVFSDLMYAG